MANRRKAAAIGLSMLDLISNSLAAMIILFIIISSLRLPSIPPERVEGVLVIRYEMNPMMNNHLAESDFWLSHDAITEGKRFYYHHEGEITMLNNNTQLFATCGGWKNNGRENDWTGPCIYDYTDPDNPNIHYVVVKNPPKGRWKTGLIDANHDEYIHAPQPAKSIVKAWFVGKELMILQDTIVPEFQLTGPTHTHPIEFDTPSWE
ncbi:MAG: hypothetical protein MI974_20890 [Chitinophagales bacterium]|nr:hypothetical protein [Chitinophagales bacterium]